jgi:hypothetical protein
VWQGQGRSHLLTPGGSPIQHHIAISDNAIW